MGASGSGKSSLLHALSTQNPQGSLAVERTDFWNGQVIHRVLIAAAPGLSPPPGVEKLPGPGQSIISPQLRKTLGSASGANLRGRYGTVSGVISARGLAGPEELFAYTGVRPAELRNIPDVRQVGGFGQPVSFLRGEDIAGVDSGQYIAVISVLLIAMLTVLIAISGLLSATTRNVRIASMRLTGASARQGRFIVAGEALATASVGSLIGAFVYLGSRSPLTTFPLGGVRFFSGDYRSGGWGFLVVIGVPILAVLITVLSTRGALGSPVEIRRAAPAKPRAWPRWLLWGFGLGLQFPALFPLLRPAGMDSDAAAGVALIGAGVLVLALPAVLPLFIRALGRATAPLARWLPFQLTTRRWEQEPFSAGRVVSLLALATIVVGAAQTFGLALRISVRDDLVRGASSDQVLRVDNLPTGRLAELKRAIPSSVSLQLGQFNYDPGQSAIPSQSGISSDPTALPEPNVLIAPCDIGSRLLGLSTVKCPENGILALSQPGDNSGRNCTGPYCAASPAPGSVVLVTRMESSSDPAGDSVRVVFPPTRAQQPPSGSLLSELAGIRLVIPPEIFAGNAGGRSATAIQTPVALITDGSTAAEQRDRDLVASIAASAQVSSERSQHAERIAGVGLNSAILSTGSSISLAVAAGALVVAGTQVAWQRRRPTALLLVSGAKPSVLRQSHALYLAVPLCLSILLGTGQAVLNALVYARLGDSKLELPPAFFSCVGGVGVVALATVWITSHRLIAPVGQREIPRAE